MPKLGHLRLSHNKQFIQISHSVVIILNTESIRFRARHALSEYSALAWAN